MFDFKDTSELDPLENIIGQKRAVEAIDFGLNMKGSGYNIFVTGLEGTGKSTIIKKLLIAHAKTQEISEDLCLVNNFDDAYCPVVIEMPAGSAIYFSQSMTRLIEVIKTQIPAFFETPSFQEEQNIIHQETLNRQKKILPMLNNLLKGKGCQSSGQKPDIRSFQSVMVSLCLRNHTSPLMRQHSWKWMKI